MVTNYERGRRIKYRLHKIFREDGWMVARSAGSKGPVDLVAVRRHPLLPNLTEVVLIQVKAHRAQPVGTEFEALPSGQAVVEKIVGFGD